ncbi:hypothetical protein D3C73_1284580 [compost metagenome]
MNLEGRLIEIIHADLLCQLPAHSSVFVRIHIPICWNNQTVLGLIGTMAVRGVDDISRPS